MNCASEIRFRCSSCLRYFVGSQKWLVRQHISCTSGSLRAFLGSYFLDNPLNPNKYRQRGRHQLHQAGAWKCEQCSGPGTIKPGTSVRPASVASARFTSEGLISVFALHTLTHLHCDAIVGHKPAGGKWMWSGSYRHGGTTAQAGEGQVQFARALLACA